MVRCERFSDVDHRLFKGTDAPVKPLLRFCYSLKNAGRGDDSDANSPICKTFENLGFRMVDAQKQEGLSHLSRI